ncbi:MAG: hypothetical protein FD188_1428 [Ignavibacteria bacterium]|nr:MAG: hypothetical protein FD188_1428 [Ignavibacteria bacterium]
MEQKLDLTFFTNEQFFTGLMSYFSSDIFGPREVILTEYLIGNQDA